MSLAIHLLQYLNNYLRGQIALKPGNFKETASAAEFMLHSGASGKAPRF